MPARLFRERFVTILVGLVLLFSNRLRKDLFFSDSVDSFTLHRIVSDFSNGIIERAADAPLRLERAERLDGIEPGCSHRRVETEDYSDACRYSKRHEQRGRCDDEGNLKAIGEYKSQQQAEEHPDHPTYQAQGHSLDQKLVANILPLCSKRHANTYFPRALRHRDNHDIHDSYSSDRQ